MLLPSPCVYFSHDVVS
uniref:Uncharacterized protein n=1 Tax=Arundo donax TaxID=35708 RepID=A0A0A8ZLJ0_ARUDO